MERDPRKRFNIRAFVALSAAATGLCLLPTGLATHVLHSEMRSPEGQVWVAAHVLLGLAFVVFALWHVLLNRRVLANHFRGSTERFSLPSREAVCAIALVVLAMALAMGHSALDR